MHRAERVPVPDGQRRDRARLRPARPAVPRSTSNRWQQVFINLASERARGDGRRRVAGHARSRSTTRLRGRDLVIRVERHRPRHPRAPARRASSSRSSRRRRHGTGLGLGHLLRHRRATTAARSRPSPSPAAARDFSDHASRRGRSRTRPPRRRARPSRATRPRPARAQRVLVVDDDQVVCDVVVQRSRTTATRWTVARDGRRRCASACARRYDVVLTDLRMPGELDGIGLYDRVREEMPHLVRPRRVPDRRTRSTAEGACRAPRQRWRRAAVRREAALRTSTTCARVVHGDRVQPARRAAARRGDDRRWTTYWDYIRVEELLALQGGLERDETRAQRRRGALHHVHQVYELWFKLVLRELVALARPLRQRPGARAELARGRARPRARSRASSASRPQHWEVMETITTRDYLDFRDKLFPASGFQSAQLREIEILLGPRRRRPHPASATSGGYMKALTAADGAASPALDRVERAPRGPAHAARGARRPGSHRTPIRGSHAGDAGRRRGGGRRSSTTTSPRTAHDRRASVAPRARR